MTLTSVIERRLNKFLIIILVCDVIEITDTKCGKPGRSLHCGHPDTKEAYEVNEIIKYDCTDCYIEENLKRQCLPNGTWSGSIPICHKVLSRKEVRKLSLTGAIDWQAHWSMDRNSSTCYNTQSNNIWEAVLTNSCNISFVVLFLPGPARVHAIVQVREGRKAEKTCGQFNDEIKEPLNHLIFYCNGMVGDSVHISHFGTGFRVCEVAIYLQPEESCLRPDYSLHMITGRNLVSERNFYKLECKSDYELVGESTVECQSNGTWTTNTATCKQKSHCGQLPSISNGFLRVNTTTVNSTAFLECNAGYRPVAISHIYCLPTGEWSSNSINCEAIRCDSKPTIPNGKGVLLDNSTYLGSKLQVVCDRGYKAIESEPRECFDNATWGNLDICVEIKCGPLSFEGADDEQWVALNGTTSIRVLICERGYYVGSPAFTQCLQNGSWSYTTAVCKRLPKNNESKSEWTPSALLMSATAVGAGSAICILCLVLSFLIVKNRKQPQKKTTVFHVEVADTSLYSGVDQCYKSTYEDVIELRHSSFSAKPRKPSSALPHLPVETDPVYAQPFESNVEKIATVNATDIYTAHIYSEPIDSQKPKGENTYNNVAETWLKSGAKRFGRKMSLPAYSSPEDSMLPTDSKIAICKTVCNSSNVNSINTVFDHEDSKLELISNSIYSAANSNSLNSCKDSELQHMIDNDIYQEDYFTNV